MAAEEGHYIADIKKSWKRNWPAESAGKLEGAYEEERESERRLNPDRVKDR